MATFEITSPDGRKFRVTAPEGATQEEVFAYAQANMPAAPAPKPPDKFDQALIETEDPGVLGSMAIGSGRMLDQIIKGGQQAYHEFRGNAPELAKLKQQEDENKRIYGGLQKIRPIATGAGEALTLAAGVPMASGVAGGIAAGAIPGLLAYGTPEEKTLNAIGGGIGGGVGSAVGKAIGRVAQPFRGAGGETQAEARAAAQRLGVDLRAGEISQSKPLRWAEESLKDLPFAAGMAEAKETARRQAINAAAARSIGQRGETEVSERVLGNARADIGNVFDNLLAGRRIELDQGFRNAVTRITDSKVMPALRDESIEAIIAPFKNMPAGKIKVSGEWFQQNKSALDAAIKGAYIKGETGKAIALGAFERAMLDAAKRSMNTTERRAFEAAEKQWASLRLLETGKVVEGGNVMPGRLDQALINRYKHAYKEGKLPGPLADIGKLSQVYKPLPQSGTVPRAMYSMGAMGSALLRPMMSVGAAVAPPLAQKFLQSKAGKAYLTRGLMNVTKEKEEALAKLGYGLLGSPLSLNLSP